jgi:arylsulfatase A-like enzyme
MRSPSSVSFAEAFTEALSLGCAFGLLHALAETSFLGWSGIRPTALDLAIFVVISAGGAIALALLVAAAAMMPPLRSVLGTAHSPFAFRRALWTILTGVYFLVFLRIVYYWSQLNTMWWALAAAPFLIFAWWAVARSGQRALVALSGTALAVATLCALQIIHAEWGNKPDMVGVLSGWLLGLIGVWLLALIAMVIARRRTSAASPFEPISRGALPLLALVAVWAVFWISPRLTAKWPFQGGNPAAANTSRPNFVLVVLDTVRADHLDLFGYERETMPNLRRFAEQEAQFFGPMFTTSSWTIPSHGSMFTGLYSSAHGAHNPFLHDPEPPTVSYALHDDTVTLAEILSSLGYQTSGIAANFGALSGFGLSRGFADYDVAAGSGGRAPELLWFYRFHIGAIPTPGELIRVQLPDALQPYGVLFSLREPRYRRAWEITEEAQQWLEAKGDQPFFLFVNYFDAHAPYLPLPQDDERFGPRPAEEEWRGFAEDLYSEGVRGRGDFTDAAVKFMIAQYDAELVGLDREIGRLMGYLKEKGFFENTVVLVTTDHGESLFEHGILSHRNSVYQPEIGGFLVLKAPPSLGKFEPSPRMQFVDFLPTILTILGEPVPPEVQGSPWGTGRDFALSELFCRPGPLLNPTDWPEAARRDLITVVLDNLKLIRSTLAPDEVYDLAADPAELNPIAAPDPAFLRRVEEVIAERNKRLVQGMSTDTEDKKLIERLRSLGYIQ